MKNVRLKIDNERSDCASNRRSPTGLLTACKNLALLILILHSPFSILNSSAAFSFSSPQIGNFFTLPGWMPKSVSAERTYGSEAASNATHRIDSIALSAVNALFEAWYERCYYAHRGNSNSWDVATYGPTAGLKRMWLNPRGDHSPAFVYDPDTNRVIETRRLVEYDNLHNLADALSVAIDSRTSVNRPNWEITRWDYGYETHVAWSSSLFDGLPLDADGVKQPDELPVSGWLGPQSFADLYSPAQWVANAMTFARTQPSGIFLPSWGTNVDHPRSFSPWAIPYNSVRETEFGEWWNLYGIDLEERFSGYDNGSWHSDKTTVDVIGGPRAVTNIVYESVTNTVTMSYVNDALLGSRVIPDYLETLYRSGYSTNLPFTVEAEIYYNEDDVAWSVEAGAGVYPYFRTETPRGSFWVYDASGDPVGGFPSYPPGVLNPFLFGGTVEPGRFPEPYPLDEGDYEVDFSDAPSYETMMPLLFSATWDGPYSDLTFSLRDNPEITEPYEIGTIVVHYPPKTNVTVVSAGVTAITNDSRRLFADWPGAIGMALAAMDRTYCGINVPWQNPTLVTNRHAWAERVYEAEFEAEAVRGEWDSDQKCYVISVTASDGLPTPVKTGERSTVEGRPAITVGDSVNARVSSAVLALGLGAQVKPGYVDCGAVTNDHAYIADRILERLGSDVEPGEIIHVQINPERGAEITSLGVAVWLEFWTDGGECYDVFRLWEYAFPMFESVPCFVTARTSTGYDFGETITMPRWRDGFPTYPGEHSRVTDATLWSFLSTGFNDVIDPSASGGTSELPLPVAYSVSNTNLSFSSTYRMVRCSYGSPEECRSAVSSLVDQQLSRCNEHVAQVFGADPSAPVDVLNLTEAGMRQAGTLASLRLAANARIIERFNLNPAWLFFQSTPGDDACVEMRFIAVDGNQIAYHDSLWKTSEGNYEYRQEDPDNFGFFTLTLDAEVTADNPPYETPCPGSAATGKLKPWSRVDWNWNALKRERNNQ